MKVFALSLYSGERRGYVIVNLSNSNLHYKLKAIWINDPGFSSTNEDRICFHIYTLMIIIISTWLCLYSWEEIRTKQKFSDKSSYICHVIFNEALKDKIKFLGFINIVRKKHVD